MRALKASIEQDAWSVSIHGTCRFMGRLAPMGHIVAPVEALMSWWPCLNPDMSWMYSACTLALLPSKDGQAGQAQRRERERERDRLAVTNVAAVRYLQLNLLSSTHFRIKE